MLLLFICSIQLEVSKGDDDSHWGDTPDPAVMIQPLAIGQVKSGDRCSTNQALAARSLSLVTACARSWAHRLRAEQALPDEPHQQVKQQTERPGHQHQEERR